MILYGNQRAGAKNLALHLLKEENELVEVHELRGFISDDLISALEEARAVSKGTRAKQYLFSLSLNPPPEKNVPTPKFESAIERAEERLGLTGQPRAIVFHVKDNRRHCHVVWSRINEETMTAVPLPFTKQKLMNLSRELYIEHGWQMPRGMMASEERDPTNYTLAQWQQAKRIGKNPKAIKQVFQDCWATSDNRTSFAHALKSRGYILAKGDRRGFVAIDQYCEVYAVSKWSGNKARDVKAKLGEPDNLPSVEQARADIAKAMGQRLNELRVQQQEAIGARLETIRIKQQDSAKQYSFRLNALKAQQEKRWSKEAETRQHRFKKGLRGWIDRITGARTRIEKRNMQELLDALRRDQRERDALIFRQIEERKLQQARMNRLNHFAEKRDQNLQSDLQQYREIEQHKRELFELRKARKERPIAHSTSPKLEP